MRRRLVTRGAAVVMIWAAMNATLAFITFAFTSNLSLQERSVYFAAVAILLLTTALVFYPHHRARSTPVPAGGRAANGAPAAAFAVACMLGAFAWVFGVFLAYLAVPLLAFVLARLRVQWAERQEERR